jgi:hypothetical protein
MLTKKEGTWIIITIILFAFIIVFPSATYNPLLLFLPVLIILISVITKKIAADFFCIKIEHTAWEWQQFWWYKTSKFKKPIPLGVLFPFLITLLSFGLLKPLTFLQFNAKNNPQKRILKKRGAVRKEEINESDLAFTSAWGFFSVWLLAILGIFLRIPDLTKWSIYYGLWNLVPIGNLDGIKLFFGSTITWVFMIFLYIIAIIFAILI